MTSKRARSYDGMDAEALQQAGSSAARINGQTVFRKAVLVVEFNVSHRITSY